MARWRQPKQSESSQPQATAVCPYCGAGVDPAAEQCRACTGRLDELNQQVTQQHMGPWYVRLPHMAFRPGFSYAVLKDMVRRSVVEADTIIRGPTTRQYWRYAKDVPGVAHLMGICHACGQWVESTDKACPHCSREFPAPEHRNYLGLDPDNFKLLRDVAQRERAAREQREQPPQPVQQQAQDQPQATQQGQAQGQPQQPAVAATGGGTSSALGAGDLSELAEVASERGRQAPKAGGTVPRSRRRRADPFVWALIAISAGLALFVVLLLMVVLLRGGEENPPAESQPESESSVRPAVEIYAADGAEHRLHIVS